MNLILFLGGLIIVSHLHIMQTYIDRTITFTDMENIPQRLDFGEKSNRTYSKAMCQVASRVTPQCD